MQDESNKTQSAAAQDKKVNMEDPQQVFNRDREQLERSLDSLRRCTKTDAMATKRDLGKMIREGVLLTKELNTLRKNARNLQLQKKAITQVGTINAQTDVSELMEFLGLKVSNTQGSTPGKGATQTGDGYHLIVYYFFGKFS